MARSGADARAVDVAAAALADARTLATLMLTDCYEKGHTPRRVNVWPGMECAKCDEPLYRVTVDAASGQHIAWHTQAELDRLWQGVDREAARILSEEGK